MERLIDVYWDLIASLIFIARADGQMRDKERGVIAEICLGLADEYPHIPRYRMEWELKDLRTLKNEEFEAALKRLVARGEKEMRLLARGAEQIIGTQKTVSPGEAYCVETINRIFGKRKEG